MTDVLCDSEALFPIPILDNSPAQAKPLIFLRNFSDRLMIAGNDFEYWQLDVMSGAIAQLQCPKCGAGLSYTALYPRWWAYEAFFPELKVPMVRICGAVVVIGVLLALVHPVLAVIGVLAFGAWASYRYFGALQCDGCRSYFIRGQFNRDSPRTHGDSRGIVRYTLLAAAIIAAISIAVFAAQGWYASTCEANCGKDELRMDTKSRLFECKCIAGKP